MYLNTAIICLLNVRKRCRKKCKDFFNLLIVFYFGMHSIKGLNGQKCYKMTIQFPLKILHTELLHTHTHTHTVLNPKYEIK